MSPGVYATLCPYPQHHKSVLLSMYPTFALGTFLALFGTVLRAWAYKVLGTLFTYDVTLRPAHKLITNAPYNIVRHPSYTGLFIHFTGMVALFFVHRGWNHVCGIVYSWVGSLFVIWFAVGIFSTVSIWRRGAVEDKLMKKTFGEAWDNYYHRVPYKYFPGLI